MRIAEVKRLAKEVERDLTDARIDLCGVSSTGKKYTSIRAMWLEELNLRGSKDRKQHDSSDTKELNWYDRSFRYWEKAEKNVDGVLGGYAAISPNDLCGSEKFLNKVKELRPEMRRERAADCGAGIGRITRDFLVHHFNFIDMVEQSPSLIAAAGAFLGDAASNVEFICVGLQDFYPEPQTYDAIWVQWVVGYLTDVDFVEFFKRCKRALAPSGIIVVKDNCSTFEGAESHTFVVDNDDSSLTRCLPYFFSLFKCAGLEVILYEAETSSFPDEIFPVYFFAMC